MKRESSYGLLPPYMSEMKVVLLGNSWSERSSVGNLILGETKFSAKEKSEIVTVRGQLKDKEIFLTNMPDLLRPNISEDKLRKSVENCVRLSAPGPHVLLLVLQPEDFNEEQKLRLCRVLELFSDQSFDHSLVLISTPREEKSGENCMNDPPLKEMIRMCRYRYLSQKNLERPELLTRLSQIMKENRGEHLSCDVSESPALHSAGLIMTPKSEHIMLHRNLVLFGRRGAGKTLAAKAILGQTEIHSVSNSSECVKHQGEVCGCWVSLVELPALYGEPQETVMKESFRCVSLCDPEGVHAFILVLPVCSVTEEDEGELKTIKNIFSSQVNDFTMILFIVDSDPTDPAVVKVLSNTSYIQDLRQSCGGRSVVLNIKDKKNQVFEMLKTVEEIKSKGSRCFTKDMFINAQMIKVVEQEKTNTKLKTELQELKQRSRIRDDDENQSKEPLRMVLIGRTGSGKSSTANAILGKKLFKPRITPKSPLSSFEKVTGELDGRPVVLVKIPPLFDTSLSEDKFQQEIKNCVSMLSPGPHVFLLVLQIGNFTQEEKDSVEQIKKYFGKESQDFIIIIFTRGDDLEDQSFESYIEDCPEFVKQLTESYTGRYQVFSNKDDTNRTQVSDLLTKIEAVVKNNGGNCYIPQTCCDTEQVEKIIKEKEEEIKMKEEDLRRKNEDLKTLRRKIDEQRGEIEQEKKLRAKQLKEKDESINKEREERKKEREEEEKRRKKQEETQRQEWRKKLETSERLVKLEKDQRESAEKKLELYRKEMRRDRDAWDKEKKDMWEQTNQTLKQNLEEEKTSFIKLQQEYQSMRRKWTYCFFVLSLFLLLLFYHFIMSYRST